MYTTSTGLHLYINKDMGEDEHASFRDFLINVFVPDPFFWVYLRGDFIDVNYLLTSILVGEGFKQASFLEQDFYIAPWGGVVVAYNEITGTTGQEIVERYKYYHTTDDYLDSVRSAIEMTG